MKIFKKYTYSWWQIGIFKLSLLCFGVTIGAYWQYVFLPYLPIILGGGVVLGFYVMAISLRQ
jgi:hypothetical protein